eukprot:TRINITY_DN3177_c0_g2_i1.p2 TRINITY_DN3177_c0_g2~~TRINITY_DN3177_c0_g2_i1.p2  ORF type:complete len:124 (-),score=14.34 TRINITY_DN3177_c0_g2_i1:222-593(-)
MGVAMLTTLQAGRVASNAGHIRKTPQTVEVGTKPPAVEPLKVTEPALVGSPVTGYVAGLVAMSITLLAEWNASDAVLHESKECNGERTCRVPDSQGDCSGEFHILPSKSGLSRVGFTVGRVVW